MRKQLAVLAIASGALVGVTGVAGADTTDAGAGDAARPCRVQAVEDVNIRKTPSTNAAILGSVKKGKIANSTCGAGSGGGYQACGKTSNLWFKVSYADRVGYVAAACVRRV